MSLRIAVTGVPGTGKTTLCNLLEKNGFRILDLNKEAMKYGCLQNEEVDIDCMKQRIVNDDLIVMDSHYSHLLDPFCVIITECSPEILLKRLEARGYDSKKISENLDVLLSDAIYQEANESVPGNRIMRSDTDKGIDGKDFKQIMDFIRKMERKYNGS